MKDDTNFDDLMRSRSVPLKKGEAKKGEAKAEKTRHKHPFVSLSDSHAGEDYDVKGEFTQNGVDRKCLRQLRKATPSDRVDLHGLTVNEARVALEVFLSRALARDFRVVEVVHGKGVHAADGRGKLRAKVRQWLCHCYYVLAYSEPPNNNGAVFVQLRSVK